GDGRRASRDHRSDRDEARFERHGSHESGRGKQDIGLPERGEVAADRMKPEVHPYPCAATWLQRRRSRFQIKGSASILSKPISPSLREPILPAQTTRYRARSSPSCTSSSSPGSTWRISP